MPTERLAVAAATLALLALEAEETPVLVIADDLHWIDPSSREALLFAARRLGPDGIAVLLSVRREEEAGLDVRGIHRLELGGLDEPAADELLRARLPAMPGAEVVREARCRAREGTPLALVEVAGGLDERQRIGLAPIGTVLPVGPGVEAAVRGRLDALPGPTRAALTVLAAAGPGDEHAVPAALVALGLDSAALDPAERAGLVAPAGRPDRFPHPLTRSAILAAAPAGERRRAHAALAAALDGRDERRAWHLAEAAGDAPDDEASAALERVGDDAAARGDLHAASRYLARAGRLSTDRALRGRRLVRAASAAALSGLEDGALFEEAFAAADDDALRAEALHVHLSGAAWRGNTSAVDRLAPLARSLAETASPPVAAALLLGTAILGWGRLDGRFVNAVKEAWALVGGRASADDPGSVFTGAFLAASCCYVGEPSVVLEVAEEVEAALRSDPPWPTHPFVFPLVLALMCCGQAGRAEALAQTVLPRARASGAVVGVCWIQNALAAVAVQQGDLAGAGAAAEEARGLARISDLRMAEGFALLQLAWCAALRGDRGGCLLALREARASSPDWQPTLVQAEVIAGIDAAAGGAAEEAVERLVAAQARLETGGVRTAALFPALPELVEALARADRHEEAERYARRLEELVPTTGGDWVRAVAARCRGLLAPDDEIDARFQEALEHHGRDGGRLETARTSMLYGERMRRAGRRSEARERLRAALADFEEIGAAPWAERCRAELRASGARVARPPESSSDLTPQELQVAMEVSAGRSNPEVAAALFISRKTVEMHLTRIYRKLGITNRAELVRFRRFAERGPRQS